MKKKNDTYQRQRRAEKVRNRKRRRAAMSIEQKISLVLRHEERLAFGVEQLKKLLPTNTKEEPKVKQFVKKSK
jgi:hypothetical protein